MEINFTELKLLKSGDSCVRFAMKDGKANKEYPTFFCLDKESYYQTYRDCMLGTSKMQSYPMYDDGLYIIKWATDGMKVVYSNENRVEFFTFPCKEVVRYIDALFESDVTEFDLTPKLGVWQDIYGPRVIVNIEPEVLSKLTVDQEQAVKGPYDLVKYLSDWASSYSDGNLITVNICFDGWSNRDSKFSSYYWWFEEVKTQKTIYNGGFIAHCEDYPPQADSNYSYSVHT